MELGSVSSTYPELYGAMTGVQVHHFQDFRGRRVALPVGPRTYMYVARAATQILDALRPTACIKILGHLAVLKPRILAPLRRPGSRFSSDPWAEKSKC